MNHSNIGGYHFRRQHLWKVPFTTAVPLIKTLCHYRGQSLRAGLIGRKVAVNTPPLR